MARYKWVIVVVVVLLLVLRVSLSVTSLISAVPTVSELHTLPVIVIDPGHGGIDGGAVGVDGVVEKDINLGICLTLRDLFRVNGFEVVMIREEDISIHDPGVEGTRNQKVSDLHNRLALAQQTPGSILLSVHQNKFGDSSSKGAQVFYSPNHDGSRQLAEILQADVVSQLQEGNKRKCKPAGKNLYLMTEATCPAILMECGFLSNPGEAAQLVDTQYQAQMAFVIFQSVMEYLELDQPGTVSPEGASV